MKITLLLLQAFVSVALILSVLIHSAKGEGLGGIGGPAKIFKSSRGLESGLDRITTILAGLFFLLAGLLNVIF